MITITTLTNSIVGVNTSDGGVASSSTSWDPVLNYPIYGTIDSINYEVPTKSASGFQTTKVLGLVGSAIDWAPILNYPIYGTIDSINYEVTTKSASGIALSGSGPGSNNYTGLIQFLS